MPLPPRPPRERDIERYLTERVAEYGGETRKVQWIGRHGAPDRLVMLPQKSHPAWDGILAAGKLCWAESWVAPACTIWVELKAPGEKAKPHQLREHARMQALGQTVLVIDSFDGVDALLGPHPVLANIAAAQVAEARPPKLAGACGNCGRDVYMGSAFFYGRGVYCTTLGCTNAAPLLEEKP